jgi:hypothetical protein
MSHYARNISTRRYGLVLYDFDLEFCLLQFLLLLGPRPPFILLCLDPLGRFFQLELPLPVGRLLHLLQLLLLFKPLLSLLVLPLSLSNLLLQLFANHKLLAAALTRRLWRGCKLLGCFFLLNC